LFEREQSAAEEAARAAGLILRELYEKTYDVREKSRDNPVTEADLRANDAIRSLIRNRFPDDGWLSEETRDSPDRLARPRTWIVDPLDGTKEFIQHIPELCVCIALVERGEPVVGVSFNPITDELFSAVCGQGMYRNGARSTVSDVSDLAAARVLASRSEERRGEWEVFKKRFRVEPTGSVAYKLARIAAGLGDATFSLTPKNEWDVCAGTALIREAGGVVTDRYGQGLRFNRPDPQLPGIIAANRKLFDPLRALITEIGPQAAATRSQPDPEDPT
jgi:myo-inositol-1(or 4)-monophosphatase